MSYVIGTNRPNPQEKEAHDALKRASEVSGLSVSDLVGAIFSKVLGTACPPRAEGIKVDAIKKVAAGEYVRLRAPRTPAEHRATAAASA